MSREGVSLSGGNAHDAPEGRALLESWQSPPRGATMVMDRAYEGHATRQLVLDPGMMPVVPPKANRLLKWDHDRTICKRWNGCSAGSKDTAASSHASRNST